MSPVSEYELVLMLDPEAAEDRREQIAADARQRIESAGALRHGESWGMRKLAYEVEQRNEADYRFFRFEGTSTLLEELDHALKIADGVLRFRLFKVDPRAPLIEPPAAFQASRLRKEGGRGGRGEERGRGSRPPRTREGEGAEARTEERGGDAEQDSPPGDRAGEAEAPTAAE